MPSPACSNAANCCSIAYAKRAGRKIRGIRKSALDSLQSYSWPGNIRELQNVIEQSLIVCETDEFTIDLAIGWAGELRALLLFLRAGGWFLRDELMPGDFACFNRVGSLF